MKKLLCFILILSVLLTPTLAFSDISSREVSEAADALSALGIVNGVGGDYFSPNANLTRSQFCKIAVLALNTSDVTAYKRYTVFPDVKSNYWGAGYINAAVRKYNLVKGLPNGTFAPEKPITYGEACTMLLYMLGYKAEDIGNFWPQDYINKAKALNITNGVELKNPSTPITRGETAIMLRNLLTTNTKDGDILLSTTYKSILSNRILISTYETDSALDYGQIKFYDGTDTEIYSLKSDVITSSMIGSRGYVVFDENNKNKVLAFVPENSNSETFTVKKTSADKIETTGKTLKPSNSTIVILGGEKKSYSDTWFDIPNNGEIKVYYLANGKIDIIAPISTLSPSSSYIYGANSATIIPSGYKIIKNGVVVTSSDLKSYDAIALDNENSTAIVTDKKITGYYLEATGAYSHPSSIKMYGNTYQIPASAAPSFSTFKYGDKITLILDSYNNVVGAYPESSVSEPLVGIIIEENSNNAKIALSNGVTLNEVIPENRDISNLYGKLVSITPYSTGKNYLRSYSGNKVLGNYDISKSIIGTTKVSPKARIYERAANTAPFIEIDLKDIKKSSLFSSHIINTAIDSAGNIITVYLENVTGENYYYGRASVYAPRDSQAAVITLTISNDTSYTYVTGYVPEGVIDGPIGMPKGSEKNQGMQTIHHKQLKNMGTVSIDNFNGSSGVMTENGFFNIVDNVSVYSKDMNKFISLSTAKANYTKFTVYADDILSNGGKIRVIYVS